MAVYLSVAEAGENFRTRIIEMCLEAATAGPESVDKWRRQRRTLERLPFHLAGALLHRLHRRRLLFPSLLEVFEHSVEEVDFSGDKVVDVEWLAYLGAFRHLRVLKLADCRGFNSSSLWPISGLSVLKELDLSRCSKITDAVINCVTSIQTLEKLSISQTGLTTDGVMVLSSVKNLHSLDLGGIPITDKALISLQALTRLEYLNVWGSHISNAGAVILGTFPRLSFLDVAWTDVTSLPVLPAIESLNISNCAIQSIFPEDGISTLRNLYVSGTTFSDFNEALSRVPLSSLTLFDMSGCSVVDFVFLDNMKQLEHLYLQGSNLSDKTIWHVVNAGMSLKSFNANYTMISSSGFRNLTRTAMNLVSLSLAGTGIQDEDLEYMKLMPSLESVDLSQTNIKGFICQTAKGSVALLSLIVFCSMGHLESLNLEDTELRDEALCPLVSVRKLKHLHLRSSSLSEVALHSLSKALNLRSLGFQRSALSDNGLLDFVPPMMLHLLDLRGSWFLSLEAIATFCNVHPKIEVRHKNACHASVSEMHKLRQHHLGRRKVVELPRHLQGMLPKLSLADERIKYGREELMQMQHTKIHMSFVALPQGLWRED